MKNTTLTLNVDYADGVAILRPVGRFDAYQVPTINGWLSGHEAELGQARVVVNLQDVQFIDTLALATLVKWMKTMRSRDGDMKLCGLRQPVLKIFALSRLDRAFDLYDSEDAAIRAFG